MQFINLQKQYQLLKNEIDQAVFSVMGKTQFILGEEVFKFEEELKKYTQAPYVVTCANGTDALILALKSIGIGTGDEVITPAFGFIAAAEAISHVGAKVVFCDIDIKSYNIDIANLENKITKKTKAIIPISLFGLVPNINKINQIAQTVGAVVIEDAAQSMGASFEEKKSGNLSQVATTSFFPTKPLGCFGDGGAIFTQDEEIYHRLKKLRSHGQEKKYEHLEVGFNSRLDTLQASILLVKLKYLDFEIKERIKRAHFYYEQLTNIDDFKLPILSQHCVYAQFSVRSKKRDQMIAFLKDRNIPTFIHYPRPLHLQPCFKNLGHREGDFPQSEKAAQEIFSLPFCPYLSKEDQELVIRNIEDFYHETALYHSVL